MNDSQRVVAGLLLGLGLGIGVALSGSEHLLAAVDLIAPLGVLWVTAIRMCVIPLIVALLITGITSASDLKAVGRMGSRTLLVFVVMLLVAAVIVSPVMYAFFGLLPRDPALHPTLPPSALAAAGELATSGSAPSLGEWIGSLLPANPIRAAADGAMIPLVLFTLLFALATAKTLPESRATLTGFFSAVSEAMLVLVGWVIKAAPIGVFALMLSLGARTGVGVAGAIGIYILAYSGAALAVTFLLYPVVRLVGRVPIRQFARATLPAQLIAISSSSSIAALPALVAGAETELRIPAPVRGFVLPLAISTFKFAAPVSWTTGVYFVAWFYGVQLHLPQLLTVAFATVALNFGSPGVPRGAFLMLAPLFQAVGLPAEAIGLVLAVDAIPDLFATVLNVTGDMAATTFVQRLVMEPSTPHLHSASL